VYSQLAGFKQVVRVAHKHALKHNLTVRRALVIRRGSGRAVVVADDNLIAERHPVRDL
jgi:hypothetical protein